MDARPGSPSRSTIVGAAVAVAVLIGTTTFARSLDDLVHRPADYGWNFDAALFLGNGYDNADPAALSTVLGGAAYVARWSSVWFGAGTIGGVDVPLLGMETDTDVPPQLLSGRMVGDDDEIVLGRGTASTLGVSIGDEVMLTGGDEDRRLTVVGLATLPTIGKLHADHTSLGRGGIVTRAILPGGDLDIFGNRHEGLGPNAVFVDLDDPERDLARLADASAPLSGFAGIETLGVQRPAEIVSARDIARMPALLASILAAAAALSLLLALSGSVRAYRGEIAVLGSLGLTRRQSAAAVLVQAAVVVGLGLAIGEPLGYLLGRSMWTQFAKGLGVAAPAATPAVSGIVVAAAGLVLAVGAAIRPARLARRVDLAASLRS